MTINENLGCAEAAEAEHDKRVAQQEAMSHEEFALAKAKAEKDFTFTDFIDVLQALELGDQNRILARLNDGKLCELGIDISNHVDKAIIEIAEGKK